MVLNRKRTDSKQSIRVKITRPVPSVHMRDSARLSEIFFHLLAKLLTALVLIAVLLACYIHWQISHEQAMLTQLAEQGAALQKEHATLLVRRNELMSKSRIAAAAAARLGLQFPEKEQVHRLY